MRQFLDFEKPIATLEARIEELRHTTSGDDATIMREIAKLQNKIEKQYQQIYSKLSPWQKTQVARHPDRPHTKDYIHKLVENFIPLSGDRLFSEDNAIIAGLGKINGFSAAFIGLEKGSDTESRIKHNFGMARPEGYRKAQRIMKLAETFQIPVITLVDTAGAYPGMGAEERGQAEAIAKSIQISLELTVPIISVVIGEGGSGGAIALATANKIYMLSHAIYSVISPEGCASILWRSREHAQTAAEALKLTAQDLKQLKIIDHIIEEPLGGAHRSPDEAIQNVGKCLADDLKEIYIDSPNVGSDYKKMREDKFFAMTQQFVKSS